MKNYSLGILYINRFCFYTYTYFYDAGMRVHFYKFLNNRRFYELINWFEDWRHDLNFLIKFISRYFNWIICSERCRLIVRRKNIKIKFIRKNKTKHINVTTSYFSIWCWSRILMSPSEYCYCYCENREKMYKSSFLGSTPEHG